MADVISRLRLDSGEFDSKIKRAGQEIMAYSEHCRKMGLEMGYANKDAKDFAKALGNMETTSSSARGKINELSEAFVNLKVMYKNMTDEERNNTFGKSLAASLDNLKTRIQEAKRDLADVTSELNGKSSANGGFLSGIGSKMEGALAVFGGNLMTKAAGIGVGLVTEMTDAVKQGIELAKAGEGVRIAFERLGRGDILQGLREATHGTVTDLELMKAAVKFNDFKLPVEELGTMLAFAQQKAKDTGQSVDYMVDSIVTGLGRKSLMILDNLGLSAAEIKERMKETGDMTKAVGEIIREQMASAGEYVETAADRAAQANVSLQNKMEELGRKFAPVEEASNQLWTSMKIGILDVIGGPLANLLNGLTEAGRRIKSLQQLQGGGDGQPTKVDKQLSALRGSNFKNEKYRSQMAQYDQDIRVAEYYKKKYAEAGWAGGGLVLSEVSKRFGIKAGSGEDIENLITNLKAMRAEYQKGAEEIMKPVKADIDTTQAEQSVASLKKQLKELEEQRKKAVNSGDQEQIKTLTEQINQTKTNLGYLDPNALKTTSNTKQELDELQKVQAKISELTKEAYTADESRVKEITKEIAGLQQQEKKLIAIRDIVTNKNANKSLEKGLSGVTNESLNYWLGNQKKILDKTEFGTQKYSDIYANIVDTQTLTTILQQAIQSGLTNVAQTINAEELWDKILNGENIPDKTWQSLVDAVNTQLAELGIKPISLDFKTGKSVSNNDETKNTGKRKTRQELAEEYGKNATVVGVANDLTSSVNGILSGIQQMGIEIPEGLHGVISGIQGVMTILTSINTILGVIEGLNYVGILPFFAHGGIVPHAANGYYVPGNSYSGDQTMVMANAGELVLSRSQQSTLASALEGNGLGNLNLSATISGEQIRLVLNNNGRRTGRGEYVQTNFR